MGPIELAPTVGYKRLLYQNKNRQKKANRLQALLWGVYLLPGSNE